MYWVLSLVAKRLQLCYLWFDWYFILMFIVIPSLWRSSHFIWSSLNVSLSGFSSFLILSVWLYLCSVSMRDLLAYASTCFSLVTGLNWHTGLASTKISVSLSGSEYAVDDALTRDSLICCRAFSWRVVHFQGVDFWVSSEWLTYCWIVWYESWAVVSHSQKASDLSYVWWCL